ncbi:hypothetical protein GCM10025883_01940 [Mobilicoccus caccae]|uniref:Uncharacterized protein n=1 Tax=Mobilicoccus caccae TaxID=1859295 RepID=A0ABQ6IKB9_9MICO|nr:hypothetical protein GCM10025883_01940 [Mobilicoccus caccae]
MPGQAGEAGDEPLDATAPRSKNNTDNIERGTGDDIPGHEGADRQEVSSMSSVLFFPAADRCDMTCRAPACAARDPWTT